MTPLNVLGSPVFGITMKKVYFVATIVTAMLIVAAAIIASSNTVVLAQQSAGQGGNSNATMGATTTMAPSTGQQQQPPVYITKSGTNTYVLSGQMSSIGSFDTNYRIVGERNALRTQENLTISTITTDFKASPTIGYIRVSNVTVNTANAATAIPNPFATPEQITAKITSELTKIIDEAENNTSQGQYTEIMCSFHTTLDDMHCHYVPLVGNEQGNTTTSMMPSR
jgi:hypothetical protein